MAEQLVGFFSFFSCLNRFVQQVFDLAVCASEFMGCPFLQLFEQGLIDA